MPKERGSASVGMLYGLLRYASATGVDVEALQEAIGLGPEALRDPEARIPAGRFHAAWSQIVSASGDRDFGLHIAEVAGSLPGADITWLVMANCPDLGSALARLVRYHDLATDFVQLALRQEGAHAYLAWRPIEASVSLDRHQSEAVLAMLAGTLQRLTEGRARPIEVRFAHERPTDTSTHQRIFGCSLAFGQPGNELVIRREVLALPILLARPALLERLERLAEDLLAELRTPDSWSDRVTRWIGGALLRGDRPSLATAARDLTISARHLQNKLRQEGTSYRILLDEARKEMALQYLREPGVAICDVAFVLGFSEQSSFTHAFKRWTGTSPGQYRAGIIPS